MKKYITPIALLTVGASFVYFTSFSRELRQKPIDLVEEEVAFSVDPPPGMPEPALQFVRSEVKQYGYGQAPTGYPVFEFGAIKLKSRGLGKCGALTLVPYPGKRVWVRARRYSVKLAAKYPTANKKLLSDLVEVDPSGLRQKYDRATLGARGYYKIFCYAPDLRGNARPVDCSQVLTIQDVQQGHCEWGPGGVDASYSPLNMSVKNR